MNPVGYKIPIATGIKIILYMNAHTKLILIRFIVIFEILNALTTSTRLSLSSTIEAAYTVISACAAIATPMSD